jgi:hypothetical protein
VLQVEAAALLPATSKSPSATTPTTSASLAGFTAANPSPLPNRLAQHRRPLSVAPHAPDGFKTWHPVPGPAPKGT